MLSFGKILLLAGVILGVMVVWRWLKTRDDPPAARRRGKGGGRGREALTQDMEPCPGCGTFVAAGTGACGRPECPATQGKNRV